MHGNGPHDYSAEEEKERRRENECGKKIHTSNIAHVIFRCQNGSSDQDSIQTCLLTVTPSKVHPWKLELVFFHMKIQHQHQQHRPTDPPTRFYRKGKNGNCAH